MKNKRNTKDDLIFTLKNLIPFVSPYMIKIIISSLLGTIASIFALLEPLVIRQISTLIIIATRGGAWDIQAILHWVYIALSLISLAFIFQIIQLFIVNGVMAKVTLSIRNALIRKINLLPIKYFDTHKTGEIISYVSNDTDLLAMSLNTLLFNFIQSSVQVIGSIVILFVLSYIIGLVVIVLLPIALLLVFLLSKRMIKYYIKKQKLLSEITAISEENYTGLSIINAFNATEVYQRKFDKVNDSLRKVSIIAEFFGEINAPILDFFGHIIFAIICLVVGYLIGLLGGAPEDVATVVTAVTYSAQLLTPLLIFALIFANVGRMVAAGKRIFTFTNEIEEPNEDHKKTIIPAIKGNVDFSNVSFSYEKKKKTITNFSKQIKSGQKVAIVGYTGAGKTTLINLLMRFYETDKGNIKIDGYNIKDLNRKYVRSIFDMVLQDSWVFDGTFMENIKFNNKNISDKKVYQVCKAAYCDCFIKQMGGYHQHINSKAGLSAGQLQLLNIARAMTQDAPILILDEATSNVDVRTEILIQKAIDKLTKGRTSFVIAHRLSTIKNADIILVMKNGKLIESGKHSELLAKNGTYADIYYSQFCL